MGGRWERPAGPPSLPTTHPGAPRLSANSPGSPGLRKQGLRPQRKGGAGEGGQKPARGFAWASRAQRAASCGGGQRDEHTHTHTHTRVHSLEHLPCREPFLHSLLPEAHQPWGQGQRCKSPWRGGLLFPGPPRPAPLLPGWEPLLLSRTGRGRSAAWVRNPQELGCPHLTPQELRWAWALESCPKGSLLPPARRGGEGAGVGEALPWPPLVPGPHLRLPGGLRVWEAVSAPLVSQLGSKPSPKIKKYFGELKSARGGGPGGAGSGRSSKGALVFDKGGPLAPALVLF